MDFACPFELHIDPMKRLAIVNVEHDQYDGLELQLFDDAEHGSGVAVLIYRKDGRVDFVFTPGLRLRRDQIDVGEGVAGWREDPALQWTFSEGPGPIRLAVRLDDEDGREIRWELVETEPPVPPVQMLAPLGAGIAEPRFFPFFFMYGLRLVGRDARCEVTIDGQSVPVVSIPIPIKGHRVVLARVVPEVLIAQINPAHEGPLPVIAADGPGMVVRDGARLELVRDGDGLALATVSRGEGEHWVRLRFDPPCPDVRRLAHGEEVVCAYAVDVEVEDDVVRGELRLRRSDDAVTLLLQAEKSWWPESFGDALAIGLFPAFFRTWVRTYRWCAELRLGSEPTMRSEWERVPKARWGAAPRTIRVVRRIHAPPEAVFRALTDPAQIRTRPDVLDLEVLEPGVPEGGCGHRREVTLPMGRFTEAITAWEPPHRFEYRIRESTVPLDHEHGHVLLVPAEDGTDVEWVSIFRMPLPAVGGLIARWGEGRMERHLTAHLDAIEVGLGSA